MNTTRANTPGACQRLLSNRPNGKEPSDQAEFVITKKNGLDYLKLREPKQPSPFLRAFRACLLRVPVLRRALGNNKEIMAGLRQELLDMRRDWDTPPATGEAQLDEKSKYTPLTKREARLAIQDQQAANKRANSETIMAHPLACAPYAAAALSAAERFLRQAFVDLCMKMPEYRSGKLDDLHLESAEKQAWQRYKTLLNAPEMTEEKLDGILQQVMSSEGDATKRLALANEAVIDAVEVLSKNAKDLLKPIAKEESVPFALEIHEELRTAPNMTEEKLARLLALVAESGGSAWDKIKRAREHLAVEMMIEASPLKDDQKELLLEIGKERCLDRLQVEQYEAVARTMIDAMLRLTPEAFDTVEQAFWDCCAKLTERGNATPGLRFYAECAALAARDWDPPYAEFLINRFGKDPNAMQMARALDDGGRDRLRVLIAAFAERGGSTKGAATQAEGIV